MHPIKEVDKVISDEKLTYALEIEIDIAIESITIAGIEILLNTVFIAL